MSEYEQYNKQIVNNYKYISEDLKNNSKNNNDHVIERTLLSSANKILNMKQQQVQNDLAFLKSKRIEEIKTRETAGVISYEYSLNNLMNESAGLSNPMEAFDAMSLKDAEKNISDHGMIGNDRYANELRAKYVRKRQQVFDKYVEVNKKFSLDNSKNAFANITRVSGNIEISTLQKSFDVLKQTTFNTQGKDAANLLGDNAIAISNDRKSVNDNLFPVKHKKIEVIESQPKGLALNSNYSTDMGKLQTSNPILARGFIRINGLSDVEANHLAEHIKESFPLSPEPEAIAVAIELRRKEINKNALDFGFNQNFFKRDEYSSFSFNKEEDGIQRRIEESNYMLENYHKTNVLTTSEKQALKSLDPTKKIIVIRSIIDSFDLYNDKMRAKEKELYNTSYLLKDLREIDNDAVNFIEASKGFKNMQGVSNELVYSIIKNKDFLKSFKLTTIMSGKKSAAIYSIDGVSDMFKMSVAADISRGERMRTSYTLDNFLSFNSGYAFPKTLEGSRFESTVQEYFKNDNLTLKNIGLSKYVVINKLKPFILDNKVVTLDAKQIINYRETLTSNELKRIKIERDLRRERNRMEDERKRKLSEIKSKLFKLEVSSTVINSFGLINSKALENKKEYDRLLELKKKYEK